MKDRGRKKKKREEGGREGRRREGGIGWHRCGSSDPTGLPCSCLLWVVFLRLFYDNCTMDLHSLFHK